MSTQQHMMRVGAGAAIIGALTLFIATLLHPLDADPNDPAAAFAEYAADSSWVASHLGQFVGIATMGVALTALATAMEPGTPSVWARIGVLGTTAGVGAAAALQAVDGVALKVMVDRWAEAAGEARAHAFEGAFAVRQIEIGLASLLSVLFGFSTSAFGISIVSSRRFPSWLGWVGLMVGLGTLAGGIAQAYTGFSRLAMTLSMPANFLLLLWALAVGGFLWRLSTELMDRDAAV